MIDTLLLFFISIAGLIVIAIAYFTFKFHKDKKIEKKLWKEYAPRKLDIGSVDSLSILPLCEYYPASTELQGEPGVSYLVTAGENKILLDVGYNQGKKHPSPLLTNMEKLKVSFKDLSCIFITHLHRDHIGGNKNERKKTFSPSAADLDLNGLRVYTPTEMNHPTASLTQIREPKVLAKGIASIGPISRALWLLGLTAEQSLAVNVEGKGIVLIIGCGHQRIERIIQRTKELFDIPIYGIIGGLHYPVTASRMKFNMQRIFGTGKLPWQWISKEEIKASLSGILKENINIIGLSPHDSCDWSLNLFREKFEDKYIEIKVGKEISI